MKGGTGHVSDRRLFAARVADTVPAQPACVARKGAGDSPRKRTVHGTGRQLFSVSLVCGRFQGGRMLDFVQDEGALHFRDAPDFGEFFQYEPVVRLKVFHDHFQKKVMDAADGIAFRDFVDRADRFAELADMFLVVYRQ